MRARRDHHAIFTIEGSSDLTDDEAIEIRKVVAAHFLSQGESKISFRFRDGEHVVVILKRKAPDDAELAALSAKLAATSAAERRRPT